MSKIPLKKQPQSNDVADGASRVVRRSLVSLALGLIACATLVPLASLQGIPDPLGDTALVRLTSKNSGFLAFVLSSIYAAVAYIWLRLRFIERVVTYVLIGSAISFVSPVFYLLSLPFATAGVPFFAMLKSSLLYGPICGGGAFYILFRTKVF